MNIHERKEIKRKIIEVKSFEILTKERLIGIIDTIVDCENCKHYSDNCDGNCFELDENKVDEIIKKLKSLFEVFNKPKERI